MQYINIFNDSIDGKEITLEGNVPETLEEAYEQLQEVSSGRLTYSHTVKLDPLSGHCERIDVEWHIQNELTMEMESERMYRTYDDQVRRGYQAGRIL